MTDFAARTGVVSGNPTRRYLWTDAFAVFAFLGLHRCTSNRQYLEWALKLADLVHHTLGRHRKDDPRSGWISGLSESEGERRPTAGGLRIGKPLPERRPEELFDERLEWERDGQYFHYLTKWMHALNRLSLDTSDSRWNLWAIDLARAASASFVYEPRPGGPTRMYWKMSTDLKRPLVPSVGQLDPLDGFVSFSQLQATQRRATPAPAGLVSAVVAMRRMCGDAHGWATADPLGIGGLLTDAGQLIELIAAGDVACDELPVRLLADAQRSLEAYAAGGEPAMPLEARLAFRELGLSIGLQSIEPMHTAVEGQPGRFGGPAGASALLAHIRPLARYTRLVERIEESWLTPAAQATASWSEHRDINSAMLATSLVPDAYLLSADLRSSCTREHSPTVFPKEKSP